MKRTRLITARVRKHWTLEQAAERIGVNANTLYKWEAGEATPRFYNIQKLCEVYEASAWELGLVLYRMWSPRKLWQPMQP